MSYESKKGYSAEHAVVRELQPIGNRIYRPRTTSYLAVDTGDVHGLPLVISVKNQARLELSTWVDELSAMVDRSIFDTGIVVHKRRGKGRAADWYVTTSLGLYLPVLREWTEARAHVL
jgi:hypothetical protein